MQVDELIKMKLDQPENSLHLSEKSETRNEKEEEEGRYVIIIDGDYSYSLYL